MVKQLNQGKFYVNEGRERECTQKTEGKLYALWLDEEREVLKQVRQGTFYPKRLDGKMGVHKQITQDKLNDDGLGGEKG